MNFQVFCLYVLSYGITDMATLISLCGVGDQLRVSWVRASNHSTNWATSPTQEENLLLHWGNWVLFLKHKESVIYRVLKMPLDDSHPVCTFSLSTWKLCRVFYIHHLSATQNGIHSLQVGKLRLRLLQLFAPYHTAKKSPRPRLRGLWLHKDTFLVRSRVSWPPFSVC